MPKAKRKPGAARARFSQHPDALDDEAGTHYRQLKRQQQLDWRLADALEQLKQNDARALVRTLLDFGLLSQEMRAGFRQWLGDPPPPPPKELSLKDQATLAAVRAYRRGKQNSEGVRVASKWTAKRVLDAHPRWRDLGVTEDLLLRVHGSRGVRGNKGGREYKRIREYLDAIEFYPDLEPPKRTK